MPGIGRQVCEEPQKVPRSNNYAIAKAERQASLQGLISARMIISKPFSLKLLAARGCRFAPHRKGSAAACGKNSWRNGSGGGL